jgi:thiol:disulfide interchange protein DsbD
MMKVAVSILSTLLLWAATVNAQTQNKEEIIDTKIIGSVEKLQAGKSNRIAIELTIHEPWHVNSDKPAEDYLIPTLINFEQTETVTFGRINYPKPEIKTFEFSDSPLAVYEGTIYAFTTVTIPPDYSPKTVEISGNVSYQACNDQSCLAPDEIEFSAEFPIAGANESIAEINQDIFSGSIEPAKTENQSELVSVIESKGLLVAFLIIFVSGLALNLTPCVYPLIPITISYFGGQVGGKKGSLALYGIVYVLGMSITYSLLGVFAALTGSILGSWLQNPLVLAFIALVMVALALSMFGLYEIRVPTALSNFAGQSKQGYFGTLFMGLTVGIIAAPCIGPFVLALFTYVGEKADPLLGFLMFFVLSLGLGVPFVFLAMFSGMINHIPRSGAWMIWVRKIFGFILVAMALYFTNPLIGNDLWYYTLLAVTFLLGGIYLAWIDQIQTVGKAFPLVRSIVGILFIVIGVFFWVSSVEAHVDNRLREFQMSAGAVGGASEDEIHWQAYSEESIQKATEENKPMMIDFYADWCIPCKELDKLTFNDQTVVEKSRNFIMVKADLTKEGSPQVQHLKEKYNIKGVPTLVFVDSNDQEIPGTRVFGYITAERFLEIMTIAMQ